MPGSGVNVVAPFVIVGNDALSKARLVQFDPAGQSVRLEMEGLGEVVIVLDPATLLPRSLEQRSTAGGTPMSWQFSDWGGSFDIPSPKPAYERGPGGNPC